MIHNDSPQKAESLLQELESTCFTLEEFPDRGHVPPKLDRVYVREYLEIHCEPYRIIYRIQDDSVFVHCVLDGCRNVQELFIECSIRAL